MSAGERLLNETKEKIQAVVTDNTITKAQKIHFLRILNLDINGYLIQLQDDLSVVIGC